MGKVNCPERWATARSGTRTEESGVSDVALLPDSNDTASAVRAADAIWTVMQRGAAGWVGAPGGKTLLNCGLLDTGGGKGYKALESWSWAGSGVSAGL